MSAFVSDQNDPEQPAALTRRRLLRSFACGAPVALAVGAGLAAAQSTPAASSDGEPDFDQRTPGGPTVAGTAFDLGYDVDEIFAFVRGKVLYHAYGGALRGAQGTLWGLAGNSVDQAQLLSALLTEAKFETRFVRGALDTARQQVLTAALSMTPDAAKAQAARVNAVQPDAPVDQLTQEQQQTLDKLFEQARPL